MKLKERKLYISHSEAIGLAGAHCNGSPEYSKCQFDAQDKDFAECDAYKLFAALDDKFKQAGESIQDSFTFNGEVLCPVLNGYGRPRSESNKELYLLWVIHPKLPAQRE